MSQIRTRRSIPSGGPFLFIVFCAIIAHLASRAYLAFHALCFRDHARGTGHHLRRSGVRATTATKATTTEIEAPATATGKAASTFSWTKNWYPMAATATLDPGRPHLVHLLNQPLVLWRDGEQKWRAFEDACPHRKVPLSEGRVESDGTLMCAYHAWKFNGDGECVSVPQLEDGPPAGKLCAKARPTMELHGLVWAWGESGENAALEAALTPPIAIDEDENDENVVVRDANGFKDVAYGWDTFFDNTMDVAHGPATHHKIVGNRYLDCEPHTLNSSELRSTGFEFDVVRLENSRLKDPALRVEFKPPVSQKAWLNYTNGCKAAFYLLATPTRPGWCRTFTFTAMLKNEAGEIKGFIGSEKKAPDWLAHVFGPMFFHQDLVFLHGSEKRLLNAGYREIHENLQHHPAMHGLKSKYQDFQDNVQLAIGADKSTALFRRWLAEHGKGGIPWQNDPSFVWHEGFDMYDTYHTHTKNCVICTSALKKVKRARNILGGLGAAAGVAAVANPGMLTVWAGLAAVTAGLASTGCHKLSRLYYRYEFHHQDNN